MSNPSAIFKKDVEISGNADFIFNSAGKVGIGITNPSQLLDVNGTVKAPTFLGELSGNAATVTNGLYTTGDQTITGVKSFTGDICMNNNANLHFSDNYRQMINLAHCYGIGVQNDTLYFRTSCCVGEFQWYSGGNHSDTKGDSGGGLQLMNLDTSGNLDVSGSVISKYLSINGDISYSGSINSSNDNSAHYFGKSVIGFIGHNWNAGFSHRNSANVNSYALRQNQFGRTYLNSASGQSTIFAIADSEKMSLSSTELVVDVSFNLNSISDVENYIIDISENLSNLSQNKIENGNSNVTVENSGDITFDTANQERMIIKNNTGDIGIGKTPSHKLDVSGTGNFSSDLDVNGVLSATGGSLITVQNAVDGGSSRGIRMWKNNNSHFGIYMATSGSNKSMSGGNTCQGAGITHHSVRFRTQAQQGAVHYGFIFENSNEECLYSIRGSDGRAYFKGDVGIGTTDPSTELDVSGDISFSGTIYGNGTGLTDLQSIRIFNNQVTDTDYKLAFATGHGSNKALSIDAEHGPYYNPNSNKLTVAGDISCNGGLNVGSTVNAPTFVGDLTGNADTVTNGVYTTGNQTISGVKTFNSDITLGNNADINFSGQLRQKINLYGGGNSAYGIGVEASTLYYRSGTKFKWYKGGTHSGNNANGTKLMELDGNGNLSLPISNSTVTATNFSGSGASLTNIAAGNITGTLASARLGTSGTPQFARIGLGTSIDSDFTLDTNGVMRVRATPVNQANGGGPERGVLVLHSNAGLGSNAEGGQTNFSIEPSGNILTLSRNGGSSVSYRQGCILNLSRWQHYNTLSRSRLAFRLNHDGSSGDNESDYNTAMVICSNNSVGIGKTNPTTELDVSGDAIVRRDLQVHNDLSIFGRLMGTPEFSFRYIWFKCDNTAIFQIWEVECYIDGVNVALSSTHGTSATFTSNTDPSAGHHVGLTYTNGDPGHTADMAIDGTRNETSSSSTHPNSAYSNNTTNNSLLIDLSGTYSYCDLQRIIVVTRLKNSTKL